MPLSPFKLAYMWLKCVGFKVVVDPVIRQVVFLIDISYSEGQTTFHQTNQAGIHHGLPEVVIQECC